MDIASYDTCTRVKSDASAYVITHCLDELITKLKTLSSEDNVHEFMHHTLISYCPTAQSTSCVLGCLTYWHPVTYTHVICTHHAVWSYLVVVGGNKELSTSAHTHYTASAYITCSNVLKCGWDMMAHDACYRPGACNLVCDFIWTLASSTNIDDF